MGNDTHIHIVYIEREINGTEIFFDGELEAPVFFTINANGRGIGPVFSLGGRQIDAQCRIMKGGGGPGGALGKFEPVGEGTFGEVAELHLMFDATGGDELGHLKRGELKCQRVAAYAQFHNGRGVNQTWQGGVKPIAEKFCGSGSWNP